MGLKLEKLHLPTEAAIEAMAHGELQALAKQWRQRIEVYESLLFKARRKMYDRQSERSAPKSPSQAPLSTTPRGETTKLPSERYPDATVEVDNINFTTPQVCLACGDLMQDSGMTEDSEYLDLRPREFIVVKQRRHKHRCRTCHGSIVTAPSPPRITPGGSVVE